MKRKIELLWVWVRAYFRHPVANIRQASPIVPGRLYNNFGNVCKAVPYTHEQKEYIEQANRVRLIKADYNYNPEDLLEYVRHAKGDVKTIQRLQNLVSSETDIPPCCELCDFHRNGIPCPIYNTLEDGSTVCDSHRYVIIKQAPRP